MFIANEKYSRAHVRVICVCAKNSAIDTIKNATHKAGEARQETQVNLGNFFNLNEGKEHLRHIAL